MYTFHLCLLIHNWPECVHHWPKCCHSLEQSRYRWWRRDFVLDFKTKKHRIEYSFTHCFPDFEMEMRTSATTRISAKSNDFAFNDWNKCRIWKQIYTEWLKSVFVLSWHNDQSCQRIFLNAHKLRWDRWGGWYRQHIRIRRNFNPTYISIGYCQYIQSFSLFGFEIQTSMEVIRSQFSEIWSWGGFPEETESSLGDIPFVVKMMVLGRVEKIPRGRRLNLKVKPLKVCVV